MSEKIIKLREEMLRLKALEAQMEASPDQQISLTDPDARSMATSGRGSGVVGWAPAFDEGRYLNLHRSTLSKLGVIAHIAEYSYDRKLLTGTSWLQARGSWLILRNFFVSLEIQVA